MIHSFTHRCVWVGREWMYWWRTCRYLLYCPAASSSPDHKTPSLCPVGGTVAVTVGVLEHECGCYAAFLKESSMTETKCNNSALHSLAGITKR